MEKKQYKPTNNEAQIPVDCLKQLALDLKEKIMNQEDILSTTGDITPLFFKGIRQKVLKGEQLKILISAQTTKGKSTLAILLAYIFNEMVKNELKMDTSYDGKHIIIKANQIEAVRVFRIPNIRNEFIVIDEYSSLNSVGINATVEEAFFQWTDNVCAQKFISEILCTPTDEYNKVGLLKISIIDVDKIRKITKCILYYTDRNLNHQPIPLGYLTFEVGEILEKDFYKNYRKIKEFSWDLTLKYNLTDIRQLEYSFVKLITFKKCLRLAELGHSDSNFTMNKIKETVRETGSVYSIIGEMELKSLTQGMIDLVVEKYKLKKELNKNRKTQLTEQQKQEITEQIEIYEQEKDKMIKDSIQYIKIYLRYMELSESGYYKNKMEELCNKYDIKIKESD